MPTKPREIGEKGEAISTNTIEIVEIELAGTLCEAKQSKGLAGAMPSDRQEQRLPKINLHIFQSFLLRSDLAYAIMCLAGRRRAEEPRKKSIMKIVPIDTTSNALKARLIATAEKLKIRPSAQANHKIVAAQIALDILGVSEPAIREGFMKVWDALPASFPCNASAVNKALDLETEKSKLEKVFAGL